MSSLEGKVKQWAKDRGIDKPDDFTSEGIDLGDLNKIKTGGEYVLTSVVVSVPFDNAKDKLINISTTSGRKTVRVVKDYIADGKRILETEDIDEEK